jgi:hypothetical protein
MDAGGKHNAIYCSVSLASTPTVFRFRNLVTVILVRLKIIHSFEIRMPVFLQPLNKLQTTFEDTEDIIFWGLMMCKQV